MAQRWLIARSFAGRSCRSGTIGDGLPVLLAEVFAFVGWLEDLKTAHEGVIDGHHGA